MTITEMLLERAHDIDACDGYVVMVADPDTCAVDTHGPFTGLEAAIEADRRRHELDAEELHDVVVRVVRWHRAPA
ncbi:MAG TPA: hypothetical protein VGH76_16750 [Actinomycetospora sp.]|uniref:hypothetical protein n=1 Tax=Actinomycetospora sp. TaxID=1872135 RepID=UPI002F419DA1